MKKRTWYNFKVKTFKINDGMLEDLRKYLKANKVSFQKFIVKIISENIYN